MQRQVHLHRKLRVLWSHAHTHTYFVRTLDSPSCNPHSFNLFVKTHVSWDGSWNSESPRTDTDGNKQQLKQEPKPRWSSCEHVVTEPITWKCLQCHPATTAMHTNINNSFFVIGWWWRLNNSLFAVLYSNGLNMANFLLWCWSEQVVASIEPTIRHVWWMIAECVCTWKPLNTSLFHL